MRAWLSILLLTLSASAATADSLLTVHTHVDAFAIAGKKQPAQDGQVRIWVGASAVRRDDGTTSAILRLDRNKLYLIDHEDKAYSALDVPVDLQRMVSDADRPVLAQLVAATRVQVAVSGTSENKQIGRFAARRFDVVVSGSAGKVFDSTVWASRDVPGYEAANRIAASLAALQPGSADWARELERLPGFPVLQETELEMTGAKVRSREELVAVESQAPPSGYELPAGYKERRYDPLTGS
jgi:hypothetical protein